VDPTLTQWLAYAPKPQVLGPGRKWHVFISYRSTNRPWVLQLHDVLRHLGFEVFLDQYVLSAAAPLALSLSDGLDQSTAAVMVWSSAFEDSEWCKAEYGGLEVREKAGEGFRFVIAKLDAAKLPVLAAGKLFVDFSQERDAPRGTNLLTLLWGLEGKALPPGAVQLAQRVDELVGDARQAPDYWRVATAAESRLVQGDCRRAAERYVKAVSMAPEELGSHRATRDQALALLDALKVSQADREVVLAASRT
jgi:TIR domain